MRDGRVYTDVHIRHWDRCGADALIEIETDLIKCGGERGGVRVSDGEWENKG